MGGNGIWVQPFIHPDVAGFDRYLVHLTTRFTLAGVIDRCTSASAPTNPGWNQLLSAWVLSQVRNKR